MKYKTEYHNTENEFNKFPLTISFLFAIIGLAIGFGFIAKGLNDGMFKNVIIIIGVIILLSCLIFTLMKIIKILEN